MDDLARLLGSFELDDIAGNISGVTTQNPCPEPVFLNLGVDHRVTALGPNRCILGADKSIVLSDGNETEQHDSSSTRFTVTQDGVLAAVILL